jgi:hypothetical protein
MVKGSLVMDVKKNIAKRMMIAVLLAAGLAACHVFYEQQEIVALTKQNLLPSFVANNLASNDSYDYERMLLLLEKIKAVKHAYHAKYADEAIENPPRLHAPEVKDLLTDFYREKERFARYVLRVKYHYKGDVPRKRARSLHHHEKVLVKAIRDLEKMLRSL